MTASEPLGGLNITQHIVWHRVGGTQVMFHGTVHGVSRAFRLSN